MIVTADHGVSFQPGKPRRRAGGDNFADILSVPLFVKLPGQREGVISDRNVELIDVLPTIAEVLEIELPWPVDGISVFDTDAPERPEKRIFRPPYRRGKERRFEPAAIDAIYQTVLGMTRAFGPSSDPLALYRIGPDAGLVGRPLAELDVATEAAGSFRLRDPRLYDEVDPTSGFVPARVVGRVHSAKLAEGPLRLAVAIDGTVWAVTRSAPAAGQRAPFAAMVPEAALTPGGHEVEIFAVSGPATAPRLNPLASL